MSQAVIVTIKRLKIRKKFPCVLSGGMFNSKIFLDTVKKEINKCTSNADFIRPKVESAMGAVKLAIEQKEKLNNKLLKK